MHDKTQKDGQSDNVDNLNKEEKKLYWLSKIIFPDKEFGKLTENEINQLKEQLLISKADKENDLKSNLKTMVYDEDKVAQKELESLEENKNELIEMANRIEEI